MFAKNALLLGAAIPFTLGTAHLVLTYASKAFYPRDSSLVPLFKSNFPVITSQTSLWNAGVGFHASHSLGLISFGAIYSYLVLKHEPFLFQSNFLLMLGAVVLFCYVLLALRYWFFLPLITTLFAFVSYILGVVN